MTDLDCESFDPIQAALFWYLVAHEGRVEFETKRELARRMNVKEKTLYKLLADPERLHCIDHELRKYSLSLKLD